MTLTLIANRGEEVTLRVPTLGAEDSYGDATVTYVDRALQVLRSSTGGQGLEERMTTRGVEYLVDQKFLVAAADIADVPDIIGESWLPKIVDGTGAEYLIVGQERAAFTVFGVVRLVCHREA